MTWVVVCEQELKESDKVAMGPFEFRNMAEDYVQYTETRKSGMRCYGPHHILKVEPVMSKLQRESVDEYVKRMVKH